MSTLLALVITVGCSSDPTERRLEFMPEMIDSIAYDSFAPNPVTPHRQTLLAPPPGSIPRDFTPFPYGPGPSEAERAGRELTSPIPRSPEAVRRGEAVFGHYCTPCHGPRGEGDGSIVPPFPAPPSLVAAHAKALPDGRIYHIVSRGQGLMPAHAIQVRPNDRWRLVQFVRSLQSSSGGAG
jgi:mono/diheme cytochrome c family protein